MDDEVALMQSPQLETELSRRGSLARKILRKTPNRSGNEVSFPDQDDEEEATLLNSDLHNSTLVQELSNVEEQTRYDLHYQCFLRGGSRALTLGSP